MDEYARPKRGKRYGLKISEGLYEKIADRRLILWLVGTSALEIVAF